MTNASKPIIFAFSSCLYPAGLVDAPLANASLQRLAERSVSDGTKPLPKFLLLLGDQIYSDATAGLLDPQRADDRYGGASKIWKDNFWIGEIEKSGVPVHTMLDDHEIEDNWEPYCSADWKENLAAGRAAYWKHQRENASPAQDDKLWYQPPPANTGIQLFMADSRTGRSLRNACTCASATILQKAQMDDLKQWLADGSRKDLPKFVAMPALLLPRRLSTLNGGTDYLLSDSWDGYPASLHDLLGFIADRQIRKVVFLSGDEHLANYTRITLTTKSRPQALVEVLSIHCPALYAPFPFANARKQDFAAQEFFDFPYAADQGPESIHCTVDAQFPENGDGYVLLTLEKGDNQDWHLKVEFDGAKGTKAPSEQPFVL